MEDQEEDERQNGGGSDENKAAFGDMPESNQIINRKLQNPLHAGGMNRLRRVARRAVAPGKPRLNI